MRIALKSAVSGARRYKMINFTTPFFVFVVGILWALILDGILVERGHNYVKIKYFVERSWQIVGAWKGFFAYLIEIAVITVLIAYLSKEIIPNLLLNSPYPTLIISFLIGYGRFRKDVYGHWI